MWHKHYSRLSFMPVAVKQASCPISHWWYVSRVGFFRCMPLWPYLCNDVPVVCYYVFIYAAVRYFFFISDVCVCTYVKRGPDGAKTNTTTKKSLTRKNKNPFKSTIRHVVTHSTYYYLIIFPKRKIDFSFFSPHTCVKLRTKIYFSPP